MANPSTNRPSDWTLANHYLHQRPTKWRSLSWIAARTLIASVNDRLMGLTSGLLVEQRAHWVAGKGSEELRITTTTNRFLVAGDPGEQDGSQYVVAPALARAADREDVGFVFMLSDVIYPSGDVNDYLDGFYGPYRARDLKAIGDPRLDGVRVDQFHIDKPIYAIPGNHDWYDGLFGFAYHFLDVLDTQVGEEAQHRFDLLLAPDPDTRLGWCRRVLDRFGRTMWRRTSGPSEVTQDARGRFRQQALATGAPAQPGPYFLLETEHLDLVCIDTGMDGWLDDAQQEWLCNLPANGRPRILMTGKPLIVNRQHKSQKAKPPAASSFACLEEQVRDPANNYVAVIGGDVHNFQQYEDDEVPELVHLVTGGAGAYTHATHPIRMTEGRAAPADTETRPKVLFPGSAESLSYFASQLVPSVWRLGRLVTWFILALFGAYYVGELDRAWTVPFVDIIWSWPPQAMRAPVVIDELGAGTLAALLVLALLGLSPVDRNKPFRRLLGVVLAATTGVVAALFAVKHLGSDADALVEVYAFSVAWLCLNAGGIRLTEWWRPVQSKSVEVWRHAVFWLGLVASTVSAAVVTVLLTDLGGDSVIAPLLFFTVAVWGWLHRLTEGDPDRDEGKAKWRSQSVNWAGAAQALVILGLLGQVLGEIGRYELFRSGIVAVAQLLPTVVVCLALPLLSDVALRRSGTKESRRDAWLKVARAVRGLVLFTPLVGVAVWGVISHFSESATLRAGFGPSALVVLALGAVLAVDTLRRRLGTAYRGVVVAVVVAAAVPVVSFEWYDSWWFAAVAASLLTLVAIGMAILATHLIFVGALWLLLHPSGHRTPEQRTPASPADNAHWDFLSEADSKAILGARQLERRGAIPATKRPPRRSWRLARIAFPGLNPPFGPMQSFVSELYSLDEPPFFKHFLELCTTESELVISVHTVRGDLESDATTMKPIKIPLRQAQRSMSRDEAAAAPPSHDQV